MSIGDDVDARKPQNVGRYDVGPEILDVRGSAADIENAAFRTILQQLPVKILVY